MYRKGELTITDRSTLSSVIVSGQKSSMLENHETTEERIAIMMYDGGLSEADAKAVVFSS